MSEKGSTFEYIIQKKEKFVNLKIHDTKDKVWRHLNFFEQEYHE